MTKPLTYNQIQAHDHFEFSPAAWAVIEETDPDPISDLSKVKDGRLTHEKLLAICLDGADNDRRKGWEDYVYEISRQADLTR